MNEQAPAPEAAEPVVSESDLERFMQELAAKNPAIRDMLEGKRTPSQEDIVDDLERVVDSVAELERILRDTRFTFVDDAGIGHAECTALGVERTAGDRFGWKVVLEDPNLPVGNDPEHPQNRLELYLSDLLNRTLLQATEPQFRPPGMGVVRE